MSRYTLSRLSNRDLIRSLHALVADERARRVDILRHLIEVERRRLYAEAGCSSLFDYCVSRLKYSQSGAGRRIAAARALRRFPEVGAMLESGEANVVTVAMVAKLLTPHNKDALLSRIRARSQDEVASIVAEYRPERTRPDRVRPVCVRVPATGGAKEAADAAAGDLLAVARVAGSNEVTPTGGSGSAVGAEGSKRTDGPTDTVLVRGHEIRFVAGEAFMKKLEETKALLSHRFPNATFEQVFDAAMEAFLEAKSPVRRARRREKRSRPPVGANGAREGQNVREQGREVRNAGRHVPVAVRDAVFLRDRGRCTWVGLNGKRCDATHRLEVDHIEPYAMGGTHEASNLRLLCREHNLLAAARVYGRDTMAQYARRE